MSSIHRNIWLMGLHNFFSDFRPYFAIAVIYFTGITGSLAAGMTVFSIIMVSSALFEVPTGVFSDLIGRRKTLIFGSIASTAALTLFAAADSFWMLAVGACAAGMSRAFFSGNNDSLVHDTLKQEGREGEFAEISGKISSMFQLSLALSAIIGGLVGEWWSLRLVLWISVAPQIAAIVTSFFFVEPNIRSKETTNVFAHLKDSIAQFRKNPKLRILSIGSMVQHGIGESMFYFEPAFISALWPTWGLGVARMVNHFLGWSSFWFAGAVIKRHSAATTLFGALTISSALGLIAVGFPSAFSPALLMCMSLFFGFIMVSQGTLMHKEFTDTQRATMGSLNSLLGSLFFGACAIILGFIGDTWGPAMALLVGEIGLLGLLPMYWFLFIKR